MNPNTRVAVCCYSGDQHQIKENMGAYKHHQCPIVALSPDDARATIEGVDNRYGGLREYIGVKAIERMREHLKILLTFPEEHFLIHDADSVCLDAKLPDYLYAEPDVLWMNLVQNDVPQQQAFFPDGFPHIAFHPPWFMSRKTITTLLSVEVDPNPNMLFIDYWLVQLALKTGLPWKGFTGAVSFPTAETFWAGAAWDAVRYRGVNFVHAVKTRSVLDSLTTARKGFLGDVR